MQPNSVSSLAKQYKLRQTNNMRLINLYGLLGGKDISIEALGAVDLDINVGDSTSTLENSIRRT